MQTRVKQLLILWSPG